MAVRHGAFLLWLALVASPVFCIGSFLMTTVSSPTKVSSPFLSRSQLP